MRPSVHRPRTTRFLGLAALALLLLSGSFSPVLAHCDTQDGPVVTAARTALEQGEVTPVLQWILPEHEAEIREAFARSLAVRRQGEQARELADRWFFETLVRLHRAGEGVAYTGLRPAGTPVEPVILAADEALEAGSADELAGQLAGAVEAGVRARFRAALEAKAHAAESVDAGRRFVAAYVELTHYVEALDALAAGHAAHGGGADASHEHRR